jgi:hypothetical protein
MSSKSTSRWFNLNWLAKSYKGIPLPDLVMDDEIIVNGHKVGGCYYQPWGGEIYVNGKPHDTSNGLIIVNTDARDGYVISSLAHEFRHHLQFLHGIEFDGIIWGSNESDSYRDDIINYFSTSVTELDALLYEYNIFGDGESSEWLEWLIESGVSGLDQYIPKKTHLYVDGWIC